MADTAWSLLPQIRTAPSSVVADDRWAAALWHWGDKIDRRAVVIGGAAAIAAVGASPALSQDAFPSHAVTIINPFPPGGAADVVVRPFAAALEPLIKQPVVVETKSGAAGALGAQVAANAKPDGYTLMVHIVSLSGFAEVDRVFGRPVKFTIDDFVPIARFIADPMVLLTNDQTAYKSLGDVIEDAKTRPNQLIFSSSGMYGAAHLPMALLQNAPEFRFGTSRPPAVAPP